MPGTYGVELAVGGKTQSANFTVVKDPRLPTTPDDYAAQFALHKELVASLSKLKQAVNRLRKHEAPARRGRRACRQAASAACATAPRRSASKLSAIESVMVDPQRKSVRDVLRNPAGLNDTLFDMIAMTTTADAAPTSQTKAVSREVMAKVDERGREVRGAGRGRHRPAEQRAGQGARRPRRGLRATNSLLPATKRGEERAERYSTSVRSTSSATDGTSLTPDTEWPALQMSFHF